MLLSSRIQIDPTAKALECCKMLLSSPIQIDPTGAFYLIVLIFLFMMPMVSCQVAQLLQDVESKFIRFLLFFLSSADRRVTMFDRCRNKMLNQAIRSIKSLSSRPSILPSFALQDARMLQDVAVKSNSNRSDWCFLSNRDSFLIYDANSVLSSCSTTPRC